MSSTFVICLGFLFGYLGNQTVASQLEISVNFNNPPHPPRANDPPCRLPRTRIANLPPPRDLRTWPGPFGGRVRRCQKSTPKRHQGVCRKSPSSVFFFPSPKNLPAADQPSNISGLSIVGIGIQRNAQEGQPLGMTAFRH